MPGASKIEWTERTWNPTTGCDKVSPGCAHCYAETFAERWRGTPGHPYEQGFDLKLWPERLSAPLKWRKPATIFVNSMSDLFHEGIPFKYIDRVFATMMEADRHTFQVLTKRPERMLAYFEYVADYMGLALADLQPWPNIWLGVSIENRRFVGRADVLRDTPAAVRFISAEPLLGPLRYDAHGQVGLEMATSCVPCWATGDPLAPQLDLTGIDWLIVGGESGPQHRRLDLRWVRDLRDACLSQCPDGATLGSSVPDGWTPRFQDDRTHWEPCRRHTAFFYKQAGGRTPKAGGRELDGREWNEMPAVASRVAVA